MAPKVEQKYVSYNGEWVTWAGVTTPPPGLQPPKYFSGGASGPDNVLTWQDSATADADGYDIYWSTTDLTDWTTGTVLALGILPGVRTATHVGGQALGTVYYGIAARRGAETSIFIQTEVEFFIPPIYPPTNFFGAEIIGLTDDNLLTWVDSISPGVTGYDIYWDDRELTSLNPGTILAANIPPGTQTYTHTDGQLIGGTVYYGIITKTSTEQSEMVETDVYSTPFVYADMGTFDPFAWLRAGSVTLYVSCIPLDIATARYDSPTDSLYITIPTSFLAPSFGWSVILQWPEASNKTHPDRRNSAPYQYIRDDGYGNFPSTISDRIPIKWAYWSETASSTTTQNWGIWEFSTSFPRQTPPDTTVLPPTGHWDSFFGSVGPTENIGTGTIQIQGLRDTWMQRVSKASLGVADDGSSGNEVQIASVSQEDAVSQFSIEAVPLALTPEQTAQQLLFHLQQIQANLDVHNLTTQDTEHLNSNISALQGWIANPITTPPWLL